jgi:hypothetical protein
MAFSKQVGQAYGCQCSQIAWPTVVSLTLAAKSAGLCQRVAAQVVGAAEYRASAGGFSETELLLVTAGMAHCAMCVMWGITKA